MQAYSTKASEALQRLDQAEQAVCAEFNRVSAIPAARWLFHTISRLGDGIFWYLLMAVLPLLYGLAGVIASVHMGLTALVGIATYKWMKTRLMRERPHISHQNIRAAAPVLDRYSFPSGHTLHAVSFTSIALSYHPALAPVLVPFALMVTLSRVVLGLHYPSDVLAGAAIGGLLALLSLALF